MYDMSTSQRFRKQISLPKKRMQVTKYIFGALYPITAFCTTKSIALVVIFLITSDQLFLEFFLLDFLLTAAAVAKGR